MKKWETIKPGTFEQARHFYPKVLNSIIHPIVNFFFSMTSAQIIQRYCHLNPMTDPEGLKSILENRTRHFFWGGTDLFCVTTEKGTRKMVVIETNSCPSGQKSLPSFNDALELRGYRTLISESFLPALKSRRLPQGGLAVLYDKNYMEASGYAAALAEIAREDVFLVPFFNGVDSGIVYENEILCLITEDGGRLPIRAAIRYVTQKPWNRIPVGLKTFIYNPVLVCLSGGRNKMLAAKAYELYNPEIIGTGLKLNFPETIKDVTKPEIPLWVQRFGGFAVVKSPYSNAGQGVYTITNEKELDRFMTTETGYEKFIVQSLIGHYDWSSYSEMGRFYQIGTVPNKLGRIHVADIRLMVISTPHGFRPAAIYARRARKPLSAHTSEVSDSWEMLGTNLSIKTGENEWASDTTRLLLMDRKDFNSLGLGLDDLLAGFIQTVLAVTAIDHMASRLLTQKGKLRMRLFRSMNDDPALIEEIMNGRKTPGTSE